MSTPAPYALTPWVRGLLAANAVVYLLTITVFTGPWLFDVFSLRPSVVLSHWWTPISYMFLHAGFLHLAFNMLMLLFFGPAVESRMGGVRFATYYLVCGLGGAVLSFGLLLTTPVVMIVGASGAVFGVALAFAMFWPDTPVSLFPLPLPIRAKWLLMLLATLSLVAAVAGADDGIAHLAHLGGFLSGFLYLRSEGVIRRHALEALHRPRFAHVVPPRRGRESGAALPQGEHREPESARRDEVDRLLEKISQSGIDSLTPAERRLLDEASRRLRSD